jgi:hypothetical protein
MAIIFLFANMIYDLPKKNLRQFVLHSYFPLGIRIKLAFIIESLFNCLNWICVMLLYLPHLIMQPILYKWQGALFLIQFLFVCIILLLLGILINLIDFNIYTRKFTTSLKVKATVLLILLGLFYYYYHDYLYMLKKIMNDILDGRLHQVLINLVAFPEYDLYHHLLDEGFVLGITLIIFLALTCLLKITAKTIKDFQNSKYSYGNLGNNIFILYFVNTKRRINYISFNYLTVPVAILSVDFLLNNFNFNFKSNMIILAAISVMYNILFITNSRDYLFFFYNKIPLYKRSIMTATVVVVDFILIMIIIVIFNFHFLIYTSIMKAIIVIILVTLCLHYVIDRIVVRKCNIQYIDLYARIVFYFIVAVIFYTINKVSEML